MKKDEISKILMARPMKFGKHLFYKCSCSSSLFETLNKFTGLY